VIEAPVRDGVVVWDGRVLEVFAMDSSLRWYGPVLPELQLDGDMLKFTTRDRGITFWMVDDDQKAQVEALIQAVGQVSA
jgi:hypothetical protein